MSDILKKIIEHLNNDQLDKALILCDKIKKKR